MNIQKMQAFLFFMGFQKQLTVYKTRCPLSVQLPEHDTCELTVLLERDGDAYRVEYRTWVINRHNGNEETGPHGFARLGEAELISAMGQDMEVAALTLYDEWKRGARRSAMNDIIGRAT